MDIDFCQILFLDQLRWFCKFFSHILLMGQITMIDFHTLNHAFPEEAEIHCHMPLFISSTGFDLLIFCLGFCIYIHGRDWPVILMSISDFGTIVSRFHKISWKHVPSLFTLWEFVYDWHYSSLTVRKNSLVRLSSPGVHFEGRLLSVNSVSLDDRLFGFSFFSSDFKFCQRICKFHLN